MEEKKTDEVEEKVVGDALAEDDLNDDFDDDFDDDEIWSNRKRKIVQFGGMFVIFPAICAFIQLLYPVHVFTTSVDERGIGAIYGYYWILMGLAVLACLVYAGYVAKSVDKNYFLGLFVVIVPFAACVFFPLLVGDTELFRWLSVGVGALLHIVMVGLLMYLPYKRKLDAVLESMRNAECTTAADVVEKTTAEN